MLFRNFLRSNHFEGEILTFLCTTFCKDFKINGFTLWSFQSIFDHSCLKISSSGLMSDANSSYKVVLAGASGVGKTCLLLRLIDNTFEPEPQATVGIAYRPFTLTVDKERVKLNIWDTAGQERFRSISQTYFRRAIGAILVFSLEDAGSFEQLHTWINDLHSFASPNAVVLLVGNKADRTANRRVTPTEAEAFARRHSLTYMEASALDGTNVTEAFHRLAFEIRERVKRGKISGNFEVPKVPEIGTTENQCSC
jgi:small GTP-binding protein